MEEGLKNEDKLLSGLAYPIPILPLFLIFSDKKSIRFCRYHGWQALFFQIAIVGFSVVLSILSMIPMVGCVIGIVSLLISIGILVISVLFCIKTLKGEYVVIPVITDFAKQYVDAPAQG